MRHRRKSRLARELWTEIGMAETLEDISVATGVVLDRVQRRARRQAAATVIVATVFAYLLLDAAVVDDDVGLRMQFLAGLF